VLSRNFVTFCEDFYEETRKPGNLKFMVSWLPYHFGFACGNSRAAPLRFATSCLSAVKAFRLQGSGQVGMAIGPANVVSSVHQPMKMRSC
jgi:hypothetical protein